MVRIKELDKALDNLCQVLFLSEKLKKYKIVFKILRSYN